MGDTLTIALFTNTFVPEVNGVANAVDTFRRELMRRGHTVYVFAPSSQRASESDDDPTVIRFPSLQIYDLDYHAAVPLSRDVNRALRKVRFDIVHTHHPLWVGRWGAYWARRHHLPLITTVHTHYEFFARFVPLPEPWVKAYLRGSVRRYCNACDLVTTPGASTARHLRRLGTTAPILVLPNGVDLSPFERATPDEVRRDYQLGGRFVMGYVGRLSPEKQVHIVVLTAARVFAAQPDARLMIVGDGPCRPDLEELARDIGVADKVVFTGRLPHSEVHKYHAAIDVLLSASRGDTMPLSYAETMAAGTPVIACVGFGAVDMIGDGVNGFLVSRSNTETQMADLALALAGDRARLKAMGQAARGWSRQWRVDVATDRLLSLYDAATRLARGEKVDLGPRPEWPGVVRARMQEPGQS